MAKTSLTARLETLPFTKKHTKLLGVTGIGWALDAMDVGLISFIMAALTKQWALSPTETSWLGSIGFLGMALGATVGGLLADRFGRRYVFAATLLIYGLATGASALAGSLAVLMVFRFIVGLGLGAELPVASTLMSEFSPRAIRGRVVVILEAFWALGWILAALIGTFVVPNPNGWRWALAIGVIPALYSLIIRWGTPESVRFLESKGRTDEADVWLPNLRAPRPSVHELTRMKPTVTMHLRLLPTMLRRQPLSGPLRCVNARWRCVPCGSALTSHITGHSFGYPHC